LKNAGEWRYRYEQSTNKNNQLSRKPIFQVAGKEKKKMITYSIISHRDDGGSPTDRLHGTHNFLIYFYRAEPLPNREEREKKETKRDVRVN